MKSKYKWELDWESNTSFDHKIHLDIDLELREILRGQNVSVLLATEKDSVRKAVTALVAEQILPQIIKGTGVPSSLPIGIVNYEFENDVKGGAVISEDKEAGGISVSVRDRMKIVMNIQGDRPMNAIQALRANIAGMADVIVNDIMIHLAHKYLGMTQHEIDSSVRLRNGQVTESKAQHRGDFGDRQ